MHGNNTGNGFSWAAPEPLSESTKQLFKAIDDGNLENFKQAITEGADVNAFDKGYTPLMTIIMNVDDRPIYLKMIMLLLQHQSLDINVQEAKERNTALHLAFRMENKNFVRMLLRHPEVDTGVKNKVFLLRDEYLGSRYDQIRAYIAEEYYSQQWFFYTPQGYIEKIGKVQDKDFSHLTVEIQKAQKGKQLLNALSSIYLAKVLLDEELNPNCWERARSGEIETPLSLIIKSCLYTITKDREEVLTKLLKHKDLDFSQIKSTPSIERDIRLKRIIKQAIKERLIDAINKKDLDNVKELVEDNCFMDCAIVTAALRGVNDPIESITNYLNEKFPASVAQPSANAHNVAQGINDELIVQKLQQLESPNEPEGTKTQVTEGDVRYEREGNRNRVKRESNEPPPPNRKQSYYASAFFMLCGICTVGACLTMDNYPEMGICLTAVALGLLLIGCYFLYKGNKKDIEPSGITDNPQVMRVLISSPSFAESSYTY